MGLNVDLCQMLQLPKHVKCPRCQQSSLSAFDDYDIECGNPNPSPGKWRLSMYCPHCAFEWVYVCNVDVCNVDVEVRDWETTEEE